MSTKSSLTSLDQQYVSVPLDSIRINTLLDFDVFLKVSGNYVLYRSTNEDFTEADRLNLIDSQVHELFITEASQEKYRLYLEKSLHTVLEDPDEVMINKANLLYETACNLVKDVLVNPTSRDNINRSKNLVTGTVDFFLKGREAFLSLLSKTSFEYHLYTHSVNVCAFAIGLAQQLGHNRKDFLYELGVGALLHDIGKSRISETILYKKGPLDKDEFEIIKKHPQWGVDILDQTDEIPLASYYPVLEHHERGDRSGYPRGLSLDDMHLYSKLIAIVDCFDAMTTERVYQKAMDTKSALTEMLSFENFFDDAGLRALCDLMGHNNTNEKKSET